MDPRLAADLIRDTLHTNLIDPYLLVNTTTYKRQNSSTLKSTWIHSDAPLAQATFPRIQIKKIGEDNTILSIGTDYTDWQQVFFNIYFYTKDGFTVTVGTDNLKNDRLVEYELQQIRNTLKTYQTTTQAGGIDGYKCLTSSNIVRFDETMGLWVGYITVRYWWFNT
jgi:hypothetical protein